MSENIFEIRDLSKVFSKQRLFRRSAGDHTTALDRVSLAVGQGEVLGIAGESGSGKTTLAEILGGLQEATSGTVRFRGEDWNDLRRNRRRWKEIRRSVQMVFQDPYESLNPRFSVFRSVAEPLMVSGIRGKQELWARVAEALDLVGLRPPEDFMRRYPHQISGGQRQRVAIACAMVLSPKVLIADEPISMLDVSLRAGILSLLQELNREMGLTIVYISHDLSTMAYMSSRILVLYRGKAVELGPAKNVLENATHPYTAALRAAVPRLHEEEIEVPVISRPAASPMAAAPACPFYPRCPHGMAVCAEEEPPLIDVGTDHASACFIHDSSKEEVVRVPWSSDTSSQTAPG